MIYASNIVHETLDGETIVIHLESGNYYSLRGSGAEIWGLLEGADSVSAICAELARRYACQEGEIQDSVERFVTAIEREGLIQHGNASPTNWPAEEAAETRGPWEPPELERYGDMRDFLLVDPVHDVDDTGWPDRKAPKTEVR
ncbi:MAG: PqqD family protein [Solirubrobacterales bacterium]|nr:PqqD family protein [Solirubrobacterales bacterium]